jgi:bacterioferritin (cytochrome b1)
VPEPMDVKQVLDGLNKAICLQARSMVRMSLLAGSLRGMGAVAAKDRMREFVLAETEDLVRLTQKASALGGQPIADVGRVAVDPDPDASLPELLQAEQEAIAALHAVIPATGQESRSEALEHLLEHIIMRKQEQVDFLWHASGLDEPLEPVDTD